MAFDKMLAMAIAGQYSTNEGEELKLVETFSEVCHFLVDNPDYFSWSKKIRPSLESEEGLHILATEYFSSYRKSNFPSLPKTVPDEIVSLVMIEAFGYTEKQVISIKKEHQHAMSAENCVGALLERYFDKNLRPHGWCWCCGNFVKAVDFIRRDQQGQWIALQIKNRNNSENSSSSAIRKGTFIEKWFRSYAKTGKMNWGNLPALMQGYNLSEQGFREYVQTYIARERKKIQ